ncbi:MAG: CarD family transcriptional regulator, partial [Bacteroidaceae bacterium]|nr:CarD family transcriptional regulator [Bacteroidaceae bacterium]
MCLDELLEVYKLHPQLKALNKCLSRGEKYLQMNGLQGSSMPILFSTLQKHYPDATDKPYVFIMDDEEEAGYLYHDFVQILGDEQVLFFPSSFKRAVKYGQRDAGNEIMRTEVLSRIGGSGQLFIITSPSALSEMVVTSEKLGEQTISLSEGERVDAMFMQETLLSLGFNRVDYVYEPGQFAVRGSILDVYSFSCEFPYRIDFFGDDVDSIRTFDVNTQLSEKRLSQIRIVPQLSKETENRQCFLEFLPPASQLIIKNKEYVCQTVEQIFHEGFLQQALIAGEGQTELEEFQNREKLAKDTLLVRPSTFRVQIDKFCIIELNRDSGDAPKGSKLAFSTHIQPIFHKNFDLIFQSFQDYLAKGYRLYILADSEKQTERLRQIFQDKETGIAFTPVKRTLHAGYVDDDLKACFFTDHQIFDRFHKYNLKSEKAHRGRVALTLKEIQQFELGDYVVHVDHGIGRFGGLIRIPNGDQMQEVIKLIYNHDDIVFVSIHSLHKVSKYKGHEGEQPRISTLGTGAWERMKERTKKKIKDIARDLILLYSKRREEKGFAFSPDSFMQHELEASFIYEDTPDQLKTTQDVKQDMERQRPMDRLVCGDVGFGKTEVAVRAAFKACADNKQVAVLVPTTVLAYQHFRTFSERLRDMPVRIEYLSRARSASKTSKILEELKEGKINIIIGTHKLIGKSVKFHDLGLLIIDEEQKFGVSTKEKLRQMRTNVDTLTLTATPIPRTLQFSLMGARDLSIIQTPPPNRYPIHTQICTFNAETIAEAVNFEMSRNGQVYLVNNRISNLPDLEALVRKYVPDARV